MHMQCAPRSRKNAGLSTKFIKVDQNDCFLFAIFFTVQNTCYFLLLLFLTVFLNELVEDDVKSHWAVTDMYFSLSRPKARSIDTGGLRVRM